jgi:hypothetical protein
MKRGIITKIVTKQIKQSKELYYPFILSLFTNVFAILMYSELGTNIEIVVPTNSTFFQEFFLVRDHHIRPFLFNISSIY